MAFRPYQLVQTKSIILHPGEVPKHQPDVCFPVNNDQSVSVELSLGFSVLGSTSSVTEQSSLPMMKGLSPSKHMELVNAARSFSLYLSAEDNDSFIKSSSSEMSSLAINKRLMAPQDISPTYKDVLATQVNGPMKKRKERPKRIEFGQWLRALKLVMRTEKLHDVFETPLPPAPAASADNQALADWNALFDRHNEVACLMLGIMFPKLYRQFENKSLQKMITELQNMYGKPPGVELQELVNMFHSCKQAEGQSVSDHYNMQSIEKTISEVHSLLIEFEKSIKRNKQQIIGASSTPHVMAIQSGRVQKNKPQGKAKGKEKAEFDKKKENWSQNGCIHLLQGLRGARTEALVVSNFTWAMVCARKWKLLEVLT
ncbi:hypothetical protein Tco_0353584 [Tanacetum coccineum]